MAGEVFERDGAANWNKVSDQGVTQGTKSMANGEARSKAEGKAEGVSRSVTQGVARGSRRVDEAVDGGVGLQRRSGLRVMAGLVGLVAPLLPVMVCAILLGAVGHLCAIFLTVVAGCVLVCWILTIFGEEIAVGSGSGSWVDVGGGFGFGSFVDPSGGSSVWVWVLLVLAVFRGVLHYGEQYCNHLIAFKLLAIIRRRVFARLRLLAPAKLESRNQGDLLAVLTQDIELLEVFYAHTISPIVIAFLTCLVMVVFVAQFSWVAAVLAVVAYLVVGVLVPLWFGRVGARAGVAYRAQVAELNEFLLESLWGVDEVLQYGYGRERARLLGERSLGLALPMRVLNSVEARQRAVTNLAVLGFSLVLAVYLVWQFSVGGVSVAGVVLPVVALMGSFGPVIALANLSNSLHQTLACGERVLSVLDEEPETSEVSGLEPWSGSMGMAEADGGSGDGGGVAQSGKHGGEKNGQQGDGQDGDRGVVEGCAFELSGVGFAYPSRSDLVVLDGFSLSAVSGRVLGLYGPSGCGKSTVLKLLMRFWDPQVGVVRVFGRDVSRINTSDLRELEGYMVQETFLFQDSIANNIAVGKVGATRAEVERAARKASLHEFVVSLPDGYDTVIGRNGVSLSGGEAQRVGLARAFLHDSPVMLLDEPTSNLDSLNEGMILKALQEERGTKTVVLVSHRRSTLNFADVQVDFTDLQLQSKE